MTVLEQMLAALKLADRINVEREGCDGPDDEGRYAEHFLTPAFREEWRQIRAAIAVGERVCGFGEMAEQQSILQSMAL